MTSKKSSYPPTDEHPKTVEARKSLFLEAISEWGVPIAGIKAAGITRGIYEHWMATDKEFAQMCVWAKRDAVDEVELLAFKGARQSHDLIKYLLNANRKEVYGQKAEHVVTVTRSVKDLTDEELSEIAAASQKEKERL